MADEKIKYLLDAEDKATAKVRAVTHDIEKQVKTVRNVGGQAKASTEFVGALATQMGNTQFGQYAGGIAMLTERVSAFSEIMKLGALAQFGFVASLGVGATALVVQYGPALAKAVSLSKKVRDELKNINDELKGVIDSAVKLQALRVSREQQAIDKIKNIPEREAAIQAFPTEIQNRIAALDETLKQNEAIAARGTGFITASYEETQRRKQRREDVLPNIERIKKEIEVLKETKKAALVQASPFEVRQREGERAEEKRLRDQAKMVAGFQKGFSNARAQAKKEATDEEAHEKAVLKQRNKNIAAFFARGRQHYKDDLKQRKDDAAEKTKIDNANISRAQKALSIEAKLRADAFAAQNIPDLQATESRLLGGSAQQPIDKIVITAAQILAVMQAEQQRLDRMNTLLQDAATAVTIIN